MEHLALEVRYMRADRNFVVEVFNSSNLEEQE
jgi:hypothetical protein